MPCYYLDMELCDFNLQTFLENQRSNHTDEHWTQLPLKILTDIGNGVAFLHSQFEVHRDLKPLNSKARLIYLTLVLYSIRSTAWKIADFSLTSEVNSSRPNGEITRDFRGTANYLPPELMEDFPNSGVFTNKVDIWAMGCILYRIVFGFDAFNDYTLFDYCESSGASLVLAVDSPEIRAAVVSEGLRELVVHLLSQMLSIDPALRPEATQVVEEIWARLGHLDAQEPILPDSVEASEYLYKGTSVKSL
jgi:serine/threonine protein kinase